MFKLISWNIRQGGGKRVREILEWFKEQKAHVVALNEFQNNESSGKILINGLIKLGFTYQMPIIEKSNANGAFIASKIPANFRILNMVDPQYKQHIIAADFEAFTIISVYLPHKKKHVLFQQLFQEIKLNLNPIIIAGDYNVGINTIDQKGKSFWYQEQMHAMIEYNMVDAFRTLHGDFKEYSWYSHKGNGYRYDHTYISKELIPIIKDCYYDHNVREQKLSDHSAMILELA